MTTVETVSATGLQNPQSAHAHSEVQETHDASPSSASLGPSRAHSALWQRYLSAHIQAKSQQSRTIQGTGRGSLQQNTSSRMAKHAPWKRFENVTSGHPCWRGTVIGHQKRDILQYLSHSTKHKEKGEVSEE